MIQVIAGILTETIFSLVMHIFYVTLNNADEAPQTSRALLERQLAVCTNWFPIREVPAAAIAASK
ncbi:MAG TPA: hypothetical protein VE242_11855 [Chthoniobacterales bacterium]|nr:hypothetical protein [Chthoniobacterales bacterium]